MEVSSEMELKRSVHDAMRTEGTLSANSEAIGEISSVPILSYASLRDNSGTGNEVGSTLLFFTTALFCRHKKQRNCSYLFVFSFDSNNKLNDPIVGSLVRNG